MGRRVFVLLALVAALVLSPLSLSGAQVEAGSDAVTADKTGWWNSLQGIESGTPAAPIGGVSPGVPQQTTGVPPGDFGSGLRVGEVDKVSAIGITIDTLPGATVEEFTMTLTESADPAASNSGSAVAAITACPIVAFWVEAENARFNGRPEADCELAAAPGERDEEGRWKFDLKAYGEALLAATSTLGQHGVLLMPVGAPPETFQVTWAGLASETPPQFTFRATGGTEPEDPFATSGESFDSGFEEGSDFGGTTTFGDDIRSDSFGSGSTGGDFASGEETVPEPPAEPAPAEEAQPAATPDRSLGAQIGNIMGNVPVIAFLGFLGVVALLLMAGLALGRPVTTEAVVTRRGGVSRALTTRRTTRTNTLEAT